MAYTNITKSLSLSVIFPITLLVFLTACTNNHGDKDKDTSGGEPGESVSKLTVVGEYASGYDKTEIPQNAIDGDPDTTRWASNGMPQWYTLDLGGAYSVSKTRISFFNYDIGRVYTYTLAVSTDNLHWTNVVTEATSASSQWTEDAFAAVDARYVKIIFLSSNDPNWAGMWEAEVYGATASNADLVTSDLSGMDADASKLVVKGVEASGHDNTDIPENVIDGNALETGWASHGMPQWITLDLGSPYWLSKTRISFYNYDQGRIYNYKIDASLDNGDWNKVVFDAVSADTQWTDNTLTPFMARYIRITEVSANDADLAGIWEVELHGAPTQSNDNNSIPDAMPDTLTTESNNAVKGDVLANDMNLTDSPVTLTIISDPMHGSVAIETDNTVTYTPDTDFVGQDTFVYKVIDANGDSATASVTVKVTCKSCPAVAQLTVSWQPNVDEVLGYRLYYGPTGDSATELVGETTTTSMTVDPINDLGLSTGDTVCFRTKAYNGQGESVYSDASCTDL